MSQSWDYIAKLVCIGDSGTGKSSLTIRLCEGRFSPHHDVTIGVEFGSRIVPVGPPFSSALLSTSGSAGAASIPRDPYQSASTDDDTTTSHATSDPSTTNNSNDTKSKSKSKSKSKPDAPTSSASAPQKYMKLSLWDTAGQETYKSITRSYFRGASGALLVFDITRRATFEHVTPWLQDLRQIAEEGIVVILVGNKSDLADDEESNGEDDASTSNGHLNGSISNNTESKPKRKREVTPEEAEAWCKQNQVFRYVETSAKSGVGVERAFLEVAERIYQNIQAGKYDLNDRRSGVKGPGAGGPGAGAGSRVTGNTARTVNLSMNEVGNAGSAGRCCY
ncbi:ras-domain-containing protein [Xylona heveae TC161]|uniref:Ras-domain-containing protein n=1 Tax=Xylona heveae (strain CBS 132557 / TC161) TaxID=1328760 RepID=A0A165AK02_XYLHT|nr:ras-domain-containing protein [Xylona heveae TC161]KZF20609.1 ras-domain-containing protein [Xylona heveae TC161]